jgi:hypothetical protein
MMVRVLRPISATLLLLAVVAGATAGCTTGPHDVVTQIDRDRAAVLAHDPVTALALRPATVTAGVWLNDKLGWRRGLVAFEAYSTAPGGSDHTVAGFEGHVATVLSGLRSAGWSVYWVACLPSTDPTAPGAVTAAPTAYPALPGGQRPSGTWQWLAAAYKLSGGVSYAATVYADFWSAAPSTIDVDLLAPNQHDPADLFPDRPAALGQGSTCAEDGGAATAPQQQGVAAFVAQDWVASRTPSPPDR